MSRRSQRVQTVLGPDTLGIGQPAHYTKAWTFWFSSSGVRLARQASVMEPADNVGDKCEVFGDELRNHLTACFDQNSRPVIAVENHDGTVELRKQQGGIETRYIWTGRQPQLFLNWEVIYYSGESDVVCFYLKDDARTVFARIQRDNFAVEYTVNVLHCTLQSLTEARSASQRVILTGRTIGNRSVTLTSRLYPPFPAEASDNGQATIALVAGSHIQVIFSAPAQADAGSGTVTLLNGAYELTVQQADAGQDAAAGATTLAEGIYGQLIETIDAGQDAGAMETGIQSGEYVERVEPADGGDDAGTGTTTMTGGSYQQAVVDGSSRKETGLNETGLADGSYYIP